MMESKNIFRVSERLSKDQEQFPHQSLRSLQKCVDHVRASPVSQGTVVVLCRRPATNRRELLNEGLVLEQLGLWGDNWRERGSSSMPGGRPNPLAQLDVMNVRAAKAVALPGLLTDLTTEDRERISCAGDQLYLDLSLDVETTPPGTLLIFNRPLSSILDAPQAVLEVTDWPHRGCAKFSARFGKDALEWVNSEAGCQLNLRGVCVRIVKPGCIRVGDVVFKKQPSKSEQQSATRAATELKHSMQNIGSSNAVISSTIFISVIASVAAACAIVLYNGAKQAK